MTKSLRFLPYGRQVITDDDISAVVSVLKSDFLTQGPSVERFEQSLAEFIGCKHVVVVNSGTAALHLAYLSSGVRAGHAVIVPAITFAATANAAIYCGATPVFADVDPISGLMTSATLLTALNKAKTSGLIPKLVVPVHYAGRPVEMSGIVETAKSFGADVFEDACHALGGQYRSGSGPWKQVGNWGDGSLGACFSFHPVKHIATGEGGAVATNSDALAQKIRLWRAHGITKDPTQFKLPDEAKDSKSGEINPWYYEMQDLGWNFRMNDLCATLGESQMKRLPQNILTRIEIAGWYRELLSELPVVCPSFETSMSRHAWHLYPVHIDFSVVKKSRREVFMALKEAGIGPQVHYIPVTALPYYRDRGEISPPDSLRFYKREISLPMYPALTRDDIKRVCTELGNALKGSKP